MEVKKTRVHRICLTVGIAAAACIAAILLCLFLRTETKPVDITLNGSKEYILGDFTLSNEHRINDYVEFQELRFGNAAVQNAAVATAPDGTVYFLAVTANGAEPDRMDTVTLYRMATEDWVELYSFEIYREVGRDSSGHFLSVFCDEKSRVFLFNYTMKSTRLEARMYDPKTGECKNVGESGNISFVQTNGRACSDGKKAYFACNSSNNPWCNTLTYDFERMEFSNYGIGFDGVGVTVCELVHRDGRIYLLVSETDTDYDVNQETIAYKNCLAVYCLENFGTDKQACVFSREIGPKYDYRNCFHSDEHMQMDDEGNLYVMFIEKSIASTPVDEKYVLEVLSPNGEPLYANKYDSMLKSDNETTYLRWGICSFFFGTDGELYVLEQATVSSATSCCCVIGRFSGDKHETLGAVTDTIVLDNVIIKVSGQKYSADPAKDGWISDIICKNTVTEGGYSYMRLRMKKK